MNKQVKVLVIEDDPYICDLIILYAEKSGYIVSIANDGLTGLEMFFNLSELVRQVMARMEPLFVHKKLNVELITKEVQDIHVFADPDRIDQVIVNLIQNAIQFSANYGSVEVMLKIVEQAVVSIRDYGAGIRQEDIQSIWERFYKADRSRTKKVGTGLGLSIVKHILVLHQTDIQVESELGRGTIFTFTLPIAPGKSNNHDKW